MLLILSAKSPSKAKPAFINEIHENSLRRKYRMTMTTRQPQPEPPPFSPPPLLAESEVLEKI